MCVSCLLHVTQLALLVRSITWPSTPPSISTSSRLKVKAHSKVVFLESPFECLCVILSCPCQRGEGEGKREKRGSISRSTRMERRRRRMKMDVKKVLSSPCLCNCFAILHLDIERFDRSLDAFLLKQTMKELESGWSTEQPQKKWTLILALFVPLH